MPDRQARKGNLLRQACEAMTLTLFLVLAMCSLGLVIALLS